MSGSASLSSPSASVPQVQLIRDVLASEVSAITGIAWEDIDPSRSLDDYGLDSVDAIVTAGVLAERLGIDLPPELLIQHRTFDAIVAAVAELFGLGGPAPADEVSPVFLFAGWGGRDGRLARLAARAQDQVPSRAVMIGAWQDWIRNGRRFDDIVEEACDHVEAVSPTGPLRLGGYSQGAGLAFAATLALERRGRTVESLSVFDARMEARPPAPGGLPGNRDGTGLGRAAMRPARFLWRWLSTLFRPDREAGMLRVRLAVAVFSKLPRPAADVVLATLARIPALLSGRGGARVDNLLQMYVFSLLWADWLPGATRLQDGQCRLNLFRSEDAEATDLGWGDYCADVTIIPVGGDHQTMFDPQHIDALAAKFVTAMNHASRQGAEDWHRRGTAISAVDSSASALKAAQVDRDP